MLPQIIIGALMILVTTLIHGTFTYFGVTGLRRWFLDIEPKTPSHKFHVVVSVFVLWMFVGHLTEIGIWAALYRGLEIFENYATAYYFSSVTYTTLGYGDIVPEAHWRLLATLEAANGFILFGWTTALVFAVLREAGRHLFDSP